MRRVCEGETRARVATERRANVNVLDEHRFCVGLGPVTGLRGVARELLLYLGVDPADHPGLLIDLEKDIGEETLGIAESMLRERGIPVGDALL
jgi:hypothetical protein